MMKMRTLRTIALAWTAQAAVSKLPAQTTKPITTQSGLVQGVTEDDVTVYKGIPFAAPPLRDLRWRAPQPVPESRFAGKRMSTKHNIPSKAIGRQTASLLEVAVRFCVPGMDSNQGSPNGLRNVSYKPEFESSVRSHLPARRNLDFPTSAVFS
jgi:hypothetical protein